MTLIHKCLCLPCYLQVQSHFLVLMDVMPGVAEFHPAPRSTWYGWHGTTNNGRGPMSPPRFLRVSKVRVSLVLLVCHTYANSVVHFLGLGTIGVEFGWVPHE